MSRYRILKSIHLAGTVWFILCVGYILVSALRQAGVHWGVIFSLSGHSALLIFLLISLYLFAIFRGVGRSKKIEEVEHPLTVTDYYIVFYIAVPFLGGLAGCIGTIGVNTINQFLLGIALGTLGTTFLVWVTVDPAIGLLEMLLPASRKHRIERLAEAKAQREKRQKDRESLLAEVLAKEESNRRRWQRMLKPEAEKLAGLLTTNASDFEEAELEAMDIGINAWQVGGLSCMQHLREMAMAVCRQRNQDKVIVDYIPSWWDGIGRWRNQPISEKITLS